MKLLFIFGRNPKLSYIELVSYFRSRGFVFETVCFCDRAAIVNFREVIDLDFLLNTVAGTVKIAKIIFSCKEDELKSFLEKSTLYDGSSNKIIYFVETIGISKSVISYFQNYFKEQGIKALQKDIAPHTLARGEKERLNFIVLRNEGIVYVARTVKCFNPHEFKRRDVVRPHIEPEIMSSVRLSRILINLAGIKPKATMLDPFCGIGTILQEAMLLGYDAYGLDISPDRVRKAIENLKWAEENYKTTATWNVLQGDATKLSKYFSENTFDFIVTEPELGPLLKKLPEDYEAKKIIENLQTIYEKFFFEASKVLKPCGRISIIIPRLRTRTYKVFKIEIEKITQKTGFKVYNPTVGNPFEAKMPVLYKEKWHRIERLIYVFQKISATF